MTEKREGEQILISTLADLKSNCESTLSLFRTMEKIIAQIAELVEAGKPVDEDMKKKFKKATEAIDGFNDFFDFNYDILKQAKDLVDNDLWSQLCAVHDAIPQIEIKKFPVGTDDIEYNWQEAVGLLRESLWPIIDLFKNKKT